MNPGVGLQDKLAKQNEISRQKLTRELVKLEKVEKSDLRMIETAEHRFRSRYKKLEVPERPSELNAINVRMYETHNPGFCYHCTGAIKESGTSAKEQTAKDSYELAHSIIFTNGKVDPDKLLCLHLLAAHTTKWNSNDASTVRPVAPLLEKAKSKHFTGAWNNILPCYIMDVEQTADDKAQSERKLHEDPKQQSIDDQAIRDFEQRYRQYMESNADFSRAMSANARQTRIAPSGLGKIPIISPHVYSLLGASHELRIKQALIDGAARKRFDRSSMDLSVVDEASLSFRLDVDDDLLSRTATNVSARKYDAKSTRSPSRRSGPESLFKLDHRITMLKSRYGKPVDQYACKTKNSLYTPKELVTIKSSFRTINEAPSKSSSAKSAFRNIFERRPSTTSFLSGTLSPDSAIKKCRRCIYLNSPIKCVELRGRNYATVPILVNYQIEALVQSVLEVLDRVNPQKMKRIVETARNPDEMRRILTRPETQRFVQSLLGQSLISSPESFVVSAASVANEIDLRFEGILEKEIIALTLETTLAPSLDALIAEIRDNVFFDGRNENRRSENAKDAPCASEEKRKDAARGNNKPTAGSKICVEKVSDTDAKECCEDEKCEFLEKRIVASNIFKPNTTSAPAAAGGPINKSRNQFAPRSAKQKQVLKDSSATSRCSVKKNVQKRSVHCKESIATDQVGSDKNFIDHSANTKPWKTGHDANYLDADHIILRRMTNNQRILVGKMCASLKTKRINNEGIISERMPLAALITPALSRESIKFLTRGTAYSKSESVDKQEEDFDDNIIIPDKLTGPVLAKIRQDVAESETQHRLKSFLENSNL